MPNGEYVPPPDDGTADPPVTPWEEADGDPFTAIKTNMDEVPQRMACSRCGGGEFHVAEGEYWTGIRCVKCRWESCVRSG